MDKVSTILITGLPGSGKSTVVQNLLSSLPVSARCAVCTHQHARAFGLETQSPVADDFDVDDPRLALYFEVYDFGSGCICCSPDGDLTRALCSIGNERENAQSQLSHLIIESTGIADPRPFSRLLSTNEDITRHFRLDAVVAVLTAAPGRPVESLPNVERVRRIQIENSDCVLFRKVDLLDPQTRERVLEDERAQASRLNARLHILDAPPGAPISWPDLTARPRPAPGASTQISAN